MKAIAIHEQQYKTYILTDESTHSQLEVVPERGGIITKWRIQQQEILYLDAERFANPDLSVRGGIPILFPICGNLPENSYTYKGRQYTLKQHGFARDLPWEVTEQTTEDYVSLTLVLNSNDYTLSLYPFEFQLAFTYKLTGNTLEIHQRYTNNSTEPMPFSTGLHPYFWTTDKTQLKLEIPASEYTDQRHKTTHAFNGSFDWNVDEIDAAFPYLTAHSATITDSARKLQTTLRYNDTYSTLVFWTLKGKDFYCLEPWSAGRNALNTDDRLIYLAPQTSCETVVQIEINFLSN